MRPSNEQKPPAKHGATQRHIANNHLHTHTPPHTHTLNNNFKRPVNLTITFFNFSNSAKKNTQIFRVFFADGCKKHVFVVQLAKGRLPKISVTVAYLYIGAWKQNFYPFWSRSYWLKSTFTFKLVLSALYYRNLWSCKRLTWEKEPCTYVFKSPTLWGHSSP